VDAKLINRPPKSQLEISIVASFSALYAVSMTVTSVSPSVCLSVTSVYCDHIVQDAAIFFDTAQNGNHSFMTPTTAGG